MPVYRLNWGSESLFESMYFIRRLCTNAKKSGVQILTKKKIVFWFMKEIYYFKINFLDYSV